MKKICQYCGEFINSQATICPHCRSRFNQTEEVIINYILIAIGIGVFLYFYYK